MAREIAMRHLITILISAIIFLNAGAANARDAQAYDILIRSGRVIDGSGGPSLIGDVAVKDGRIVAIGDLSRDSAARVIDARGLAVAPGFIDMHTHSEKTLLLDGNAESMVRQGVTVNIGGERFSAAPRGGKIPYDPRQPWTNFPGYFGQLLAKGISINFGSFVDYGQLRLVVIGYEPRAATAPELAEMKALLVRSMHEGAFGLSTYFHEGGPDYPEEVIALAKVARENNGIYASHTGRQSGQQAEEYAFAIRVAEEADIPVHIYHLKIVGEENWGTLPTFLAQVEAARARGLDITANQYPWTAMAHAWASFFPEWAREEGPEKFAIYLRDPVARAKMKADPQFARLVAAHGGWDNIILGKATGDAKRYAGMNLTDIAKARGNADPAETALDLMAAENGVITGVFHNQSETDVQKAIVKPWISVASDGEAANLTDPVSVHPRSYGSNVRVLGHYSRDLHLLTLEEAVRKMTSLPAGILGLRDRGFLREGYAADIVLFDPSTVGENATYDKPAAYPTGVIYVIVNGALVIDKGEHTGARPGKPLLGRAYRAPE